MGIPLPGLLLDLRRDLVAGGVVSVWERLAFRLWSWAWSGPLGYRVSTRVAWLGQGLGALVGPGRVWGAGRALPRLAARRYRDART